MSLAFPRSGTTLLSILLDRHSRLCVPPETAFFDEVTPQLTECTDFALMTALQNWRRLPELGLEPEMVRQQLEKKKWDRGDVLAAILDLYVLRHQKKRPGEKPSFVRLLLAFKIVTISLTELAWLLKVSFGLAMLPGNLYFSTVQFLGRLQ